MRAQLGTVWALVKETVSEWMADAASTRAASLAYYTVFSIAPTLIIATSLAGFLFGQQAARGEIHEQIEGLIGATGASVVEDLINSAAQPGRGRLATVLGVIVLVFAATGVFAELQGALNTFWKTKPAKPVSGVVSFLRTRFLSFAMVLGVGFLLLVSLVASAALSAIGHWVSVRSTEWVNVTQVLNQVGAFAVITVLFALIYKIVPDAKISWGDVWLGAVITSALFNLGKLAIGLYIGRSGMASAYGATGSLAVLLVWVYYSSMVLFLGAEFTQVYARLQGSQRGAPKKDDEHATPHPPQETSAWPPRLDGTAGSLSGR